MEKKYDGKLIALEGPDGCGKSTQTKLLSEWLKSKGYEVEVTGEPTENPVGNIIRNSLKEKIELPVEAEALLFAADRVLHASKIIRPSLEEGKIVITGRYIYSSLAYQTARGLPKEWVEKINEYAMDPDLTIFIDIPPEVGLKRKNSTKGPDKFERNIRLQEKVRQAYKEFAEDENMPLIDGTLPQKEVQEKIRVEAGKILHA